jgi:hypothetical protein
LTLQNDDGVIAPGKPFDPFTAYPVNGKTLYIGSNEVFNKNVSEAGINIQLLMSDRKEIERLSKGTAIQVSVLERKQWNDIKLRNNNLSQNILADYGTLSRDPLTNNSAYTQTTQKGFFAIENNMSGGISSTAENSMEYLFNLAQLLKIKEISLNYYANLQHLEPGTDQFFHVYPFGVIETLITPYIPPREQDRRILASASLHRISKPEVPTTSLQQGILAVNANERLLPQFTYTGIYAAASGQNPEASGQSNLKTSRLLRSVAGLSPQKKNINQYSGSTQEEGLLLIGLEKAQPLQSVSLLFQFAEGSAEDEDNDPPEIHWSYLSDNEWRPLPEEDLVSDGTYGFQTTGIIKLNIPEDATNNNTIITSGLFWIRAGVTAHADRIPMLISIVSQAVSATFKDQANSPEHYGQPLAAGSIGKLATPVSQVSKVVQPFSSFDGKPQEIGKEFYARVSERLRHKNRAITAWDYEHMILDRFPSVYKVKCILHTDPNCLCRKKSGGDGNKDNCCGPQVAPGHVLLVTIPDLKNRNGVNPLQPKTARRTLIEMVNYIQNYTSPFVKVYAKNPVYEQIIVFFRVKFYTGTDTGYYLKKLNDEIVKYLTPWAFDENADVVFGQKVYASSIINFIEERSYVDFITDFEMGVCKESCCPSDQMLKKHDNEDSSVDTISRFNNCQDVESFLSENINDIGEIVAKPSDDRCILVSAPRHIIIPYEAPPVISPCEQRKLTKVSLGNITVGKQDTKKEVLPVKDKPAVITQPSETVLKKVSDSKKETGKTEATAVKTESAKAAVKETKSPKKEVVAKKVPKKKTITRSASKKNKPK